MFKDYLKKTYPVYLLYLLFVLCTFVVLMICQMILDLIIYMLSLYFFIILLYFLLDYKKYKQHHQYLIYLKDNPNRLVGLAEMFDYKKRENKITVGYRLNEDYWNKKIATNVLKLMVEYLVNKVNITTLQAFVMPENLYSSKVLLNNGFVKEDFTVQEKNWGGQEIVTVDVYTYKKH